MLPNRFCHRNWEKFDAARFLNETFQTYLKKGMGKSFCQSNKNSPLKSKVIRGNNRTFHHKK